MSVIAKSGSGGMSASHLMTKVAYEKTMATLEELAKKGSKMTDAEMAKFQKLALAAQKYEQAKYSVEPPTTLTGLVELKMFELKLKQRGMAKKLGISEAKFSLIMSGKQRPDIAFLKAVHDKLKIDGETIFSVL